MDSMPTVIRIVARALDRMASQRPAWRRVAIMTQPTLANTVDASGEATKAVVVPHLTVADVKGCSIMIHAGGDNYSDQPAPLGGGGARIACGVAK
jgi:hypothetical protein